MLTSCGRTRLEEPAGRALGTFQEQHLTQSTDKVALRTAEAFVAQLSISVWSKGNFLKQPVCLPPRSEARRSNRRSRGIALRLAPSTPV